MRHLLIILLLPVLLPAHTCGQERQSVDIDKTVMSYESTTSYRMAARKEKTAYKQTLYWEKHRKLKKYAFSALGLGVCGTIIGWIGEAGNNAHTNSNWKEDGKAWDVVLGIGIGLTISSIPLFVVSHKNKRKAKETVEFSLRNSSIHLDLPNGRRQPRQAVGVCINF